MIETGGARVTLRSALRELRRPSRDAADAVVSPLPSMVNSVALVAAKVLAMGLGFLFWVLAARIASPAEVGLAAAVVSSMMLCTQVANLGFGSAVITYARSHLQQLPALLNSALTLVVCVSIAVSLAFVLLAEPVTDDLDIVAGSPLRAATFVAAATFGTVGSLLDQSAIALRRGDQSLVRNGAFGAGTLLSLVALALIFPTVPAPVIFAPWAVAGAIATAIGLRHLRRSVPGFRPRPAVDGPLSRRLIRAALPNYVLTLLERSPGLILPIVVTELLSPASNATWYGVWMMAWVVYIVPVQVGLTVFSEVAHDPGAQRRAVRRGVRTSLAIGGLGAVMVAVAAESLLELLGEHYEDTGVAPLRILVLGWIPLTFVHCYFATARARRRLGEANAVALVSSVVSVTAAAVAGMHGGLTAMALA